MSSKSIECPPSTFSKDHPFHARLVENRLLSKPGSAKETRHFVVDIAGSGLTYSCGDSLGVYPSNPPAEVGELLQALQATGSEPVILPKSEETLSFHEALTHRLALAGPTRKFLLELQTKLSDGAEQTKLNELLELPGEALREWLDQRHFIDILQEFPSARLTPQEFVLQTRKLVPRLYSIASSPLVYPDSIHLTVAVVRYETLGRQRVGVCSTYLAERVAEGEPTVPVFIANSHFGLPGNDDDIDLIMVGPGTGVAPFRAFLQDRAARQVKGRSWLFFGDQHEATDFLYGDELQELLSQGALHRLDCAWSRDQKEKIYVQDKMRANADQLVEWLDNGAYFFVCGDAKRMAKDVDAALHDVIAQVKNIAPDEAAVYVKQLKREKRYQRDVY